VVGHGREQHGRMGTPMDELHENPVTVSDGDLHGSVADLVGGEKGGRVPTGETTLHDVPARS
jgi:hypothetical protein